MRRLIMAGGAFALLAMVAACGSSSASSNSGAGEAVQIRKRIDSVVRHIASGDAKAILDDDVPPSARRTCSDKDAKDAVGAVRREMQAEGAMLSVKSLNNVKVTGNRATADVVFGTGVASIPDTPPIPIPFVREGGSWKIDTSATSGCNGLIPTTFG